MSKRSKGVKLGLGEFLGDSKGYTVQDVLPTGPRAYDNDDGYQSRGGRGGRQHEPNRSGQVDQWRGSRDQNDNRRENRRYGDSDNVNDWRRGGDRSFGGMDRRDGNMDRRDGSGRQYGQYDARPQERPSHMRLQLKPRSSGAPPAPGGARSTSSSTDKWDSLFSRNSRSDNRSNDRFSRTDNGDNRGRDSSGERVSTDQSKGRNNEVNNVTEQLKQTNLAEKEQEKRVPSKKSDEELKREKEEKLALEAAKKAEEEANKLKEKELEEKSEKAIEIVLKSGKRGKELTALAKKAFEEHATPTGAKLLSSILYSVESAKENTSWVSLSEFGDLLAFVVAKSDPKTEQIKALYALQRYFHSISFPKGLLEKVFIELYNNEIVDEDAFLAYKYDVDDDTPGKIKAIIQTSQWLTWLETAPDEEEDDEEDEDFDLDEPLMTL